MTQEAPIGKPFGFTLESSGYDQYLYRRQVLPKLGWLAGLFGVVTAAITILH